MKFLVRFKILRGKLVPADVADVLPPPVKLSKRGYALIAEAENPAHQNASEALGQLLPKTPMEVVMAVVDTSIDILKAERIMDVASARKRIDDIGAPAASAIKALDAAAELKMMLDLADAESAVNNQRVFDLALMAALELGAATEEMAAQAAWNGRNPKPQANEAKKANARARRAAMADYIKVEGERPEKRPGAWYAGFREAYPQHAVTDKTLKADYPHALAVVRKQKKTGSNKRS